MSPDSTMASTEALAATGASTALLPTLGSAAVIFGLCAALLRRRANAPSRSTPAGTDRTAG